MSQGTTSTTDYPTLTQYYGPWLYKTQAIDRYGLARDEIEAALLPCETGPNPHRRTTSYWKYNEPDIQLLASLLHEGYGLDISTASEGTYPGFAKANGPVIDMRDVWTVFKVTYSQLARITPVEGWSDLESRKSAWVYNVCDVEVNPTSTFPVLTLMKTDTTKAVKHQIAVLVPMLDQVLPKVPSMVTTDGHGTFFGLKTNEWILNHGTEQEKADLARKLRMRSQIEGSRRRHNSNL